MIERRIAPDDHRASIEHFLERMRDVGPLGTTVHVGAHAGEEVDSYRAHGAQRIVLVEANPASCDALRARYAGAADVSVLHAAATDHEGEARLLLHTTDRGGTESASLLPMRELARIVPTLDTAGTVDVPARTLDSLLAEEGIDPGDVGLLVLDVQGAELQVLRGATRALESVRAVLTEVALIDLYEGAALEQDLVRELGHRGFQPVDALYYELYDSDRRFPAWGDVLFAPVSG
jgi:FkbM family methyltransferase